MNLPFAKEVGYPRYITRRVLWRIAPPASMRLPTGVDFPTPREKAFSSDVYVTECNVDWNSEFILAAFLKSLPAAGCLLDVGAHIGYYSTLLSPFVSGIYAFEPDARNHGYLRAAIGNLSGAEIVPQAVADKEGEMVLSADAESSVSHLDPEAKTGVFVPVTTIDAFAKERGLKVSAIKVDIEGYDILALLGAMATARKDSPVFLVDDNQEEGRPNTWAGLQEFADAAGYTMFAVSRASSGFADYEYLFREHTASELSGLSTKMIFLVPRLHRDWFTNFAAARGKWNGSALKPAAVRAFLRSMPGKSGATAPAA